MSELWRNEAMNDDLHTAGNNRYDRLRNRAEKAFGGQEVADVIIRVRAIIGPGAVPEGETLAQAALDKLRRAEEPTAEELTALEIVIRLMRPAVYTRNGVLDDLPTKPGHDLFSEDYKRDWSDFRDRVADKVNSIGRIEKIAHGGAVQHVGTGFLVADDLLVTNRHVLGALTYGSEKLQEKAARVTFKQEYRQRNDEADIIPILGVVSVHPDLDMALLQVTETGREPVEIDATPPVEGDSVVVIGYPAKDKINNPLFLSSVFGNTYGVRRAALGEVLDGVGKLSFHHDCSTSQGNSGSPLFSLKTGKVSGVHRAGFFMYRNEAITGTPLAEFALR